MISDQELYDLALQHLKDAQDYFGEVGGSHPIEAIRDDILMNKYTKDRILKVQTPAQLKNLTALTKGFYEYMEWLHDRAEEAKAIPVGYVRLYRGIKRPPSKSLIHYIPSSWTHNINTAADWVDSNTHCCILQLDYPVDQLMAIDSLPLIESTSEDKIYDTLDKNKIKIHNQAEYEVILPAMDLINEGDTQTKIIDGVQYTVYPVLADVYPVDKTIKNMASLHDSLQDK